MVSADSLATLCRYACPGNLGEAHRLFAAGDCVFCTKCGAYSMVRSKGLRKACKGHVANVTDSLRLRRLREGRHPLHAHYVGAPAPVYFRQEWALLNSFDASVDLNIETDVHIDEELLRIDGRLMTTSNVDRLVVLSSWSGGRQADSGFS